MLPGCAILPIFEVLLLSNFSIELKREFNTVAIIQANLVMNSADDNCNIETDPGQVRVFSHGSVCRPMDNTLVFDCGKMRLVRSESETALAGTLADTVVDTILDVDEVQVIVGGELYKVTETGLELVKVTSSQSCNIISFIIFLTLLL